MSEPTFSEADRERVEADLAAFCPPDVAEAIARLLASHDSLQAERDQIRNVVEAIDKEWPTDGARALLWSIRAALNPEGTEA